MKMTKMNLLVFAMAMLLPFSSHASGGYASTGKDLHCSVELQAIAKPFECDSPGGICEGVESSVVVIFDVLRGDLGRGLAGEVLPNSVVRATRSRDGNINASLDKLVQTLGLGVSISYKNQAIKMTLAAANRSQTAESRHDFSAGKKLTSEVLIMKNAATVDNDISVDAVLTCRSGNTADRL